MDCGRGAGGSCQPHCTPPSKGFGGMLGKLMTGEGNGGRDGAGGDEENIHTYGLSEPAVLETARDWMPS